MDQNDNKRSTTESPLAAANGLGDGQGTRVGSPDQGTPVTTPHQPKPATPAAHSDSASPRPERTMGSGQEATQGSVSPEDHKSEHRGGYGGSGGAPVTPSDKR